MSIPILNLGLIGAGRIGRLHAEHLARRIPGARLAMVTDIDASAAETCARRFQIPEQGTDYRRILEQPGIQAVVICSSTDTHSHMIEEAALAGKHIFCEKPIDFDLARIDRALEAVKQAKVILQMGYNRRFDPNFQRIRQAVAEGEIGTPHQLHIISRDPAPPPLEYVKKSGGIFMDMTIHDFDMARFLIGSEVTEIFASGTVRVDPAIGQAGDLDTAILLLKFADGTLGVIENSRQAVYGYDQRVEVFGSAGSIRVDNQYPNSALISSSKEIYRDQPLNFFMDRYLESYWIEMRHFVQAVLNGQPPPVTGSDGRISVLMGRAAHLSWKQNRPVRLSEIG